MSRAAVHLLRTLLLAIQGLLPLAASAAVPAWLRELEGVELSAYDDETDAVKLLDDTEVTVLPDGRVHYVERHAFRILRRSGQWRAAPRAYLGKDDELHTFRGWSIPPQGKPFQTDKMDIVESALVPGVESALVTDRRMKVLTIPAANPGHLVGYVIERTARPVLMGEHWLPRDTIPVLRSRFKLRLPEGWTYSADWLRGAAIDPSSPEPRTWQWQMENLPPVKPEENAPPITAIAEVMYVALFGPPGQPSSLRGWNELGAWLNSQLLGRATVDAGIASSIAVSTAGKATRFDKVRALAEFVQKDIRYVSVDIGLTGYQPRSAAEVLRTGFGDCKDKALLLQVMLREIGVESHLVLVNTERGVLTARSPPASPFNHAVIAIRLPAEGVPPVEERVLLDDGKGGKLLLFDPTDVFLPFGFFGEQLRSNMILIVQPDSARLVTAPAGSAADNGVDKFVNMRLAEDGTLKGSVREVWRGVWAGYERGRMQDADQHADLARLLERRLAGSIANFAVENAAIGSRTAIEKPIEWRFTLSAQEYARKVGDLMMVRPRVLGTKVSRFLETEEPRRNPIAFTATHRDADSMRIELPPGYEVESLPEPVSLDIAIASYRSSTRIDGNALVYERVLEWKGLDLPLAEVENLREFYRAIGRDERAMAILKKRP